MTQSAQSPTGHPAVSADVLSGVQTAVGGLTADQLLYIEGFIAGLRMGGSPAAAAPTATAAAPTSLTILYGSESGNSESLADATAKAAKAQGYKPTVVNMADTTPKKLASAENLLVLVSTWGEGDPPETAVPFFEDIMSDKAPRFEKTRFSVLALGDTSYEHFCQTGKDLDERLEALGGTRILPRVDCDVDYDTPYQKWCTDVLAALGTVAAPAAATATLASAAAPAPTVEYGRKNPFPSPLNEKILLNGRGSAKETIHLEFSLEGSGLEYKPGDSLAVIPHNSDDVVEAVLKAAQLKGSEPVSIKEFNGDLRTALTSKLDITALSLPVVKRYAEIAKSAQLDELLKPEAKAKLNEYLAGRDLADLLGDFPAKITADALAAICRKLPPRLYSIASSPKAHPGEVHLTVGVVRYDAHGRERKGVCSTYLADRLDINEKAVVYITTNKHFKLPDDPNTPMIMVGPGTGIAPFRAFIEERVETRAKGENWLFFGDQHYLTDFLYQTEWQSYLADGALRRLDVAFSRDQPQKIYVQDRMREQAKDLWAWLERGAYFYVCGDATRMAVDVDKALHDVIVAAGGKTEDEAAAYVKQLKSEKRYLRDVY